jgi:hypothetical protein
MKALFFLLLLTAVLCAAPATYNILKLPAGASLTIDGMLDPATEWNDAYFIDSLQSNDNCYASDVPPWTSANFQMMVYGAWDESRVYFAVRVIHDDVYQICDMGSNTGVCGCDNIQVDIGGKGTDFFIFPDNTIIFNPSCPFGPSTMTGRCNPSSALSGIMLPSYEFSLDKAILDSSGADTFKLWVGSEDQDTAIGSCSKETWVCIGLYYPYAKTWWRSQWPNSYFFPTYILSQTEGPPLGVEGNSVVRISAENLSASPNPFMPATVISYKANSAGTLKIFDVNGKTVQSFATKAGASKIVWNGADAGGRNVSAGLYIARLVSGSSVLEMRLFLMK